jgi:hypothetical protein
MEMSKKDILEKMLKNKILILEKMLKNEIIIPILKNNLLNSVGIDFRFNNKTKKAVYFLNFNRMQITLSLTYDLNNNIINEKYYCCEKRKRIKLKKKNLIRMMDKDHEFKFWSNNLDEHIIKCEKYIKTFEENKKYLHLEHCVF